MIPPADGARQSFSLVTVIVPAYNEAARIEGTLGEIRAYFAAKPYDCEIIVSADGTDGTRERVAAMAKSGGRLRVIGSSERGGKGRGIRKAVALAEGDVIGFVDADNKTPISEFDLFEPHLNNGCDVVIGSRGLTTSRIERAQPWFRRWGSKGFGLVMHAAVGLPDIVDTQCGFKFFRGSVARDLFRRQRIDGYMFDVEVLFLATSRGCRIAQVPIRWRDDGDSRLDLVTGNLRNVMDLLKIRWRRYDDAALAPSASRTEEPHRGETR